MASGFTVATNEHLIRSNLWSRQIKELLLDDLMAMRFVRLLTDFPDGTTINVSRIASCYENLTICWKPLKPFVLLSENQKGKDSIKRGQSAGKKLNERNRFSLASGYNRWGRLSSSILSHGERESAEDKAAA